MPADSLAKARTPEPRGKGGRNWITKLKPGNRGELPPYVQHVVKALIEKRGMPESQAYAIAMSRPDAWLKSKHTDAGTKAASALAKGQLEKDKAINRLRRAGSALAASEFRPSVLDVAAIFESEREVVEAIEESLGSSVLEAALSRVQWANGLPISPREHALDALAERAAEALTLAEATGTTREIGSGKFTNYLKKITNAPGAVSCPKCGALKIADKMCPSCEAPKAGKVMSIAEAAVVVVQERSIHQSKREELLKKGQAIKNADGSISYPIETPKDLESAAILARSGHGDVPAAKRLIGKMSKKLGVKNPLQERIDEGYKPKVGHHVDYEANGIGRTHGIVKKIEGPTKGLPSGKIHIRHHSGAMHQIKPERVLSRHGPKMAEAEMQEAITKHTRPRYAELSGKIGAMKVGDKPIKVTPFHHVERVKAKGGRQFRVTRKALNAKTPEARVYMDHAHEVAGMARNMHALNEADELQELLREPPKVKTSGGKVHYISKGGKAGGVILACTGRHIGLGGAIPTPKPVDCATCKRKHAAGRLHEAEIDDARPTAHAGILARVKSLKLGETARMPEGLAITHSATGDGRKVWRADMPSRWASSGWSLGDEHRQPEDAVKDAFGKSASSKDPASLGGATRLHSYSRVSVGGKEHRFLGVRPHDAKPEVRDISGVGQPGSIKVVGWDELHPADDIMQQGDGGGVLGSMLDNRLSEAASARRDTIGAIAGKAGPKDTFDFHAKGGKFSKGRANIHAQMARHVLDNPRAHNSGPIAMVATRSPSGGQVHTVKGAGAVVPHDAVHISIPAMRERIPEHAALAAHSTADEHKTTDREARHVAKVAATVGMMRGKSVVIHDDPDEAARASSLKETATRHAGAMRRAAVGA